MEKLRKTLRVEWPVPVPKINKNSPQVIVALLVPTLVFIWKHNLRKASQAELDWQQEELKRRIAKLETVIEQGKEFLDELEKERLKSEEAGEASSDEVDDSELGALDKFLLKFAGGKGKKEEFKIRFVDMWWTCREVSALDGKHPLLFSGLDMAAQILSMELSHASFRTLEAKDAQFLNGEKLKERLDLAGYFRGTCERLLEEFTTEQQDTMNNHLALIRKKYLAGYVILGKLRKLDVFSAIRLVTMAKKEIFILFLGSGLSALNGLLDALDVLYNAEAWELLRDRNFKWVDLRTKVQAFVSVRFVRAALQMLKDRVNAFGWEKLNHRLRTELYTSLLHQDFEWYRLGQVDERNTHAIFGTIFELPGKVMQFTQVFTAVIERSTSSIGQVAIILTKSSSLFKSLLAFEVGNMITQKMLNWVLDHMKWRIEHRQVSVDVNWYEPLTSDNLPTSRAFATEEKTLTNWEMFWQANMRKEGKQQVVDILGGPLRLIIDNITAVATTMRAGALIKDGSLGIFDFWTIKEMVNQVVGHFRALIDTYDATKDSYKPLARSYEIMSVKPTIGLSGGMEPKEKARGRLTFENVEFKYEEGPPVLKDMSFEIGAGTRCACTGRSGAGKTTILKLFERFHDPQKGRILLDGVDIKLLNPVWLRRQIGIVDQKPRIFSLTLRDNLILGCKDDPSQEEIEDACRAAGIHDFIFGNKEKFPAGLYTRISPHTLSGGELQRVAIARAILKNAPVLLLDEATSALDSHLQSSVKDALNKLMEGRTIVMIAHRLETIKECDQILVTEHGQIVESGTHKELVAASGHYAGLYEKQVSATMVDGATQ